MGLNRVIIKNNIILNKYIGIERNDKKDKTNIISVDTLLKIYDINTNKELFCLIVVNRTKLLVL